MEYQKISDASVREFYEDSYSKLGFEAQRRYPNEELCRFMGRNFFSLPPDDFPKIKILETGCGSGANLWMIARKGFDAYGIDLSGSAISLCVEMLLQYKTKAKLFVGDMKELKFPENHFDAVVDVFSSNCMNREEHTIYLKEVLKALKRGGTFFSYFPSKNSDTFRYTMEAPMVDQDTIQKICRETSPFYGQQYPFRFLYPEEYRKNLQEAGFYVDYLETVARTYRGRREFFEWIVIEARK